MADLIVTTPIVTNEPRVARRYLLIALLPILWVATAMFVLGLWLGPAEGDLTRIGGYSERAFGWQEPDEALLPGYTPVPRVAFDVVLQEQVASDIVVFGDSFSAERDGRLSWVDILQHRTGLSVLVVRNSGYHDVIAYLASPSFRDQPPRAVVIETVERSQVIHGREAYDPAAACDRRAAPPKVVGNPAAGPIATQPAMRRTRFENLDELYSRAAVAVRARLRGEAKAIAADLTRSDLFSSAVPGRLIFYFDDVGRHVGEAIAPLSPEAAAQEMTCGLRRLVMLAGDVPLWLVTAPDKRSIYAPWIADPLPEKVVDVFGVAQEALGAAFIDVRTPLRDAVEAGVHDVYLPNDTHWGARGHRLVGEAVANALLATTN